MTKKRFTDDGCEEIENQSFTDNLTGETYWFDNGLDELLELLNNLNEENQELVKFKQKTIKFLQDQLDELSTYKKESLSYKRLEVLLDKMTFELRLWDETREHRRKLK